MSLLPQASLFLGVIPALFILFFTLKGYEGYYKDKNMFLTFVIGMVFGFVAAFIQSYFLSVIIIVFILAMFNQLFKTIILNIGRLHQKKETPIYGLSLGLGFGSSFTPLILIGASTYISEELMVLAIYTSCTLGYILMHGTTGALIGYGIFENKLTRNLIISVLLEIPIGLLFGLMIYFSNPLNVFYLSILSISMILYGLMIFIYVAIKVLPQIKKSKIKEK